MTTLPTWPWLMPLSLLLILRPCGAELGNGELRGCEEWADTRRLLVNEDAKMQTQGNFYTGIGYGDSPVDWQACLNYCKQSDECEQVVWVSDTCYPMSVRTDQDEPGSGSGYKSAHCYTYTGVVAANLTAALSPGEETGGEAWRGIDGGYTLCDYVNGCLLYTSPSPRDS
eukprot:TRINITY_DN700_c0_g1_i14.p2 TRINITY_DN700_c0_g1~~TRINITY_DN700_c0_g1_i14.p2  ORF type:complete len:170 (-),score=26.16 TRINITY_DN700_c0_g1_i14:140-649(-)